MTIETVLNRLPNVRKTGPNTWTAESPCRESKSRRSVAIKLLDDDRVLIHDFGGDSTESILAAVGLTLEDLFPEKLGHHVPRVRRAFSARDALLCISFEALVVLQVAGQMLTGELIDRERLLLAVSRLQAALTAAEG